MSRYVVSASGVEAIHAAVVRAMTGGDGRVTAEELAAVLAENEPERFRQDVPSAELSDEQYEQFFASRFGYSASGAAAPEEPEDDYKLDFARRFGSEAVL